jgi:hypothetical protein
MQSSTTIQTYLFDVNMWSAQTAAKYLRQHHKHYAIDSKSGYHHARQIDPDAFQQGTLRTITLSEDKGIKAVIGHLR